MKIIADYDLTNLNTFRVPARAKFFVEIKSEKDLALLIQTPEFKNNPHLFLGGGSNILFTRDWNGIVVQNKLRGIEIEAEDQDSLTVKVLGGENWHELVLWSIEKNLWGLENLSSIPGSVGAAPMQNIGAYGKELKEVLARVEATDIGTGEKKVFENDRYGGGYRESIFKKEFKGKYFITAIVLVLSKIPKPNLKYKSLKEYLENNKIQIQSPREISRAVTEIRKEKLPDPSVIANAGSFFKNVLVDQAKFEELLKRYPDMPHFLSEEKIKIPSGWLIEQAGWKGKRIGNIGVYEKHALVLVNHGGGTGAEIKALAEAIIDSVYLKFGLRLEPEVNIV